MGPLLARIQEFLEAIGGARPMSVRGRAGAVALGVWWTVLFLAVYSTIGRATKFIYVDF
jgi:hypothetical protein